MEYVIYDTNYFVKQLVDGKDLINKPFLFTDINLCEWLKGKNKSIRKIEFLKIDSFIKRKNSMYRFRNQYQELGEKLNKTKCQNYRFKIADKIDNRGNNNGRIDQNEIGELLTKMTKNKYSFEDFKNLLGDNFNPVWVGNRIKKSFLYKDKNLLKLHKLNTANNTRYFSIWPNGIASDKDVADTNATKNNQ